MSSSRSLSRSAPSRPRHTAATLLAALALLPALAAQDLRQVLPEPVPPLVNAPATTEPEPDLAEIKTALGGAAEGEEVLVAELKGVVLLRDASQLGTIPLAPGQTSNLRDFPELGRDELQGAIDLFVGEAVSRESILRLRLTLGMLLAQQGRPFSVIYTPPQDITDGTLQFVLLESSVGAVRVEGARHFSDADYLRRVPQRAGDPVDAAALNTGIERINRNPFRQAALRVGKGEAPATTDVVIMVEERFPLRLFAGYNNTGTATTTEDRITAGVNWGNAFGLGHQMTVQWTSDIESRYSRSVSANYIADLPRNHTFALFGAYSEIASVPAGGLSTEGTSWQLGANYDLPLPSAAKRYTHSLQFGADFKSSDNNIEFALPPFIIPISDNLTHIVQARVEYRGTLDDAFGATTASLKVTASPGGLSSENDDTAFGGSRAGAEATYAYANLGLTRQTRLDALARGLGWTVRGELQLSSGNLLGSEQFSGGGAGSVRGYEQGEVVGDNAFFFSQELNLQTFPVLRRVSEGAPMDVLSPYLFHDYARLWNVDKLPGERPFNLHSVGVGVRYQLSRHGNVQAAYGWQLRDSGSSDTGDNSRLHFAANLSF